MDLRKSASLISWVIADDKRIKWSLKYQLLGAVHFCHCNLCIPCKQADVPPKQRSNQPPYCPHCHSLVPVTIISCLDMCNNPMTGFLLPILSFSHLIFTKQLDRIIFLKANQTMSLPCLRFFIGFPHHQKNSNTLLRPDISDKSSYATFPLTHDAPGTQTFFQFQALPSLRVFVFAVQCLECSSHCSSDGWILFIYQVSPKCHLRESYPVTSLAWYIISFTAYHNL